MPAIQAMMWRVVFAAILFVLSVVTIGYVRWDITLVLLGLTGAAVLWAIHYAEGMRKLDAKQHHVFDILGDIAGAGPGVEYIDPAAKDLMKIPMTDDRPRDKHGKPLKLVFEVILKTKEIVKVPVLILLWVTRTIEEAVESARINPSLEQRHDIPLQELEYTVSAVFNDISIQQYKKWYDIRDEVTKRINDILQEKRRSPGNPLWVDIGIALATPKSAEIQRLALVEERAAADVKYISKIINGLKRQGRLTEEQIAQITEQFLGRKMTMSMLRDLAADLGLEKYLNALSQRTSTRPHKRRRETSFGDGEDEEDEGGES